MCEYLITETGRYIAYAEGGLFAAWEIAEWLGEAVIAHSLTTMSIILGVI